MNKKNQKCKLSENEIKDVIRSARKEGHKLLEPLLELGTTNTGLLTSVIIVSFVWARLRIFAELTQRPCQDMFDELVNAEISDFRKQTSKDIEEVKKKLERK